MGLVPPGANPSFDHYAGWMFSTGSSMKSYARLVGQCGSVAEVDVAMGGKVGSLKEGAHPMPAASGLEEYCIDSGHCVDSLTAKALGTIDLMSIRVGSMMNLSSFPNSVDSRVGEGCLDSLMMNLHPPLDSALGHALMILKLLDYGKRSLPLLVSVVSIASLGLEPLKELVLFPASMVGVESLA